MEAAKPRLALEFNGSVSHLRASFSLLSLQVLLAGSEDCFIFRADCCDEIRHGKVTQPGSPFIKRCYSFMRQAFVNILERRGVWNEGDAERPEFIVGCSQVFSSKTATPFKITGLVSYPIHVVLIEYLKNYCCWLTEALHNVVSSLRMKLGGELQGICSIQEGLSSVYGFTDTDGIHAEACRGSMVILLTCEFKTEGVFVYDALMEIVRPQANSVPASVEVD